MEVAPAPSQPTPEEETPAVSQDATEEKVPEVTEIPTVDPGSKSTLPSSEPSSSKLSPAEHVASVISEATADGELGGEKTETGISKEGNSTSTSPPAPSLENQEPQGSMPPPPPSTQNSVSIEELREDFNTRKRRSQSPPPSSVEVSRKRARTSSDRQDVDFPEDSGKPAPERVIGKDEDDVMFEAPPDDSAVEARTNGHVDAVDHDVVHSEGKQDATMAPSGGIESETSPQRLPDPMKETQEETTQHTLPSPTLASPSKSSATDSRFKGLFKSNGIEEAADVQAPPSSDLEDRIVSALHPATSALYIRDLRRPLQPQSLKNISSP